MTNLTSSLRALGAARASVPHEAIGWLRDNWTVARDALQTLLARCARDPASASDQDMIAGYFALHLMAEKRETRAFPLLAVLAKSPEGLPGMFGDAMPVALSGIFISLFDGNETLLRSVLTARDTDAEVRHNAFGALAYLSATGAIDRASSEGFLKERLQAMRVASLPGEADGCAAAVALLGLTALMPEVRAICETGVIDPAWASYEDYERLMQTALEDETHLAGFEREGIAPVADAVACLDDTERYLASLTGPDGTGLNQGHEEEALAPVINPFREVGRNDPCPCGSGKKYKKCCLAA